MLAHASVHGVFTFFISILVTGRSDLSVKLALFDLIVHFTMDRIKASPKLMGRWKPMTAPDYVKANELVKIADEFSSHTLLTDTALVEAAKEAKKKLRSNTLFWWALGFDQMVHHLTHYVIIFIMYTKVMVP